MSDSSGGALTQLEMAQALAASALTAVAAATATDAPLAVPSTAADRFDDEDFPFPQGSLNGVKCCTKCGATRTPQWREGPFGPKTLCNACGVKRTRKLRAEQEGAKRRKLSAAASPAAPALAPSSKHFSAHAAAKHPARTSAAAAAFSSGSGLALDSYGSLEPELDAWGLPAGVAGAAATCGGSRRPPRRAAEEAAFKTRTWARTGEWAGEGQEAGAALDEVALRAATPSSSSDYSLPSSSCPEEVSWPPAAGARGAGGADCYAAVNLMTMSAKQGQVQGQGHAAAAAVAAAAPPPLHVHHMQAVAAAVLAHPFVAAGSGAASPTSASLCQQLPLPLDPEQFNHDSLMALAAKYDGPAPHHHKVVPVDLAELSHCLPPAKVLELVRLNQELEMAVHEAHAANAAVAAVAQVLASKQAAALRSREVAGAATKRLRRFMAELDTQFGIQSKFTAAARQGAPLSPAKPAGLASPSVLPSAAPLSPAAPAPVPRLPAPVLGACTI